MTALKSDPLYIAVIQQAEKLVADHQCSLSMISFQETVHQYRLTDSEPGYA